jgi:SPP1 family predicted phage head-tail adaptor
MVFLYKIQIGELKERIEINKIIEEKDSEGYKSYSSTLIIKCWAKCNNFFGNELYQAINVKLENMLNVTTRYGKVLYNLNPKEIEIVWKGRKFDVIAIDYNGFDSGFVTFKAKEVI